MSESINEVIYKGRPIICDDATARRVLGISFLEVMMMDMRMQYDAWRIYVERKIKELGVDFKAVSDAAFDMIVREQKVGHDVHIKKASGELPRRNAGSSEPFDKVSKSFKYSWTSLPRAFLDAKEQLIKAQWEDLCSDFWRRKQYFYMIQVAIEQLDAANGAVAKGLPGAVNEVDRIWTEKWSRWYDRQASRNAAEIKAGVKAPPTKTEMCIAQHRAQFPHGALPADGGAPLVEDIRKWALDFAVDLHKLQNLGKGGLGRNESAEKVFEVYEALIGKSLQPLYSKETLKKDISIKCPTKKKKKRKK